jgi:DNA-binding IclR family transcriptional regulator
MTEGPQSGWDRFQSLLESMTPGDEIHLAAASRDTGLPPATCETVLDALTRVDLFTRIGDHTFVRRRIDQ